MLTAAPVNRWAKFLVTWLFHDKANTLFAFLFGVGFWVQMQRIEARRADFSALYLRRLTILFIIGLLNLFFIWQWDILNLYALAGFALFALRGGTTLKGLWFDRSADDYILALVAKSGQSAPGSVPDE